MSQCFRKMPRCGQERSTVRIACCSCCCRQWQWRPSRVLPAFTESEGVQAMRKLKPTERASAASAGLFSSRNRLRAVSQPLKIRETATAAVSFDRTAQSLTGICGEGLAMKETGPQGPPPMFVRWLRLSAVWLRTTSRCLHRQRFCRQRVRRRT